VCDQKYDFKICGFAEEINPWKQVLHPKQHSKLNVYFVNDYHQWLAFKETIMNNAT